MTKFGDFDFSILHTYPWYLQKVALNKRDVNLIDLKMVFFVKKIHVRKLQT